MSSVLKARKQTYFTAQKNKYDTISFKRYKSLDVMQNKNSNKKIFTNLK